MKLTIAAITIAAFTSPALAGDDAPATCEQHGEIAKLIMENRQLDVPLHKMMEATEGNSLIAGLVLIAYDTPRFSTAEMQARAAAEFRNDVELVCFKARAGVD